jgi:hypothetical protein
LFLGFLIFNIFSDHFRIQLGGINTATYASEMVPPIDGFLQVDEMAEN